MTRTIRLMLLASVGLAPLQGSLGAQDNNCLPPSTRRTPVTSVDSLRGSTMLLAYGTAGPRKGRITSGTLDLWPAGEAMRRQGVVMVGATSIDLTRIGAQYTGSLRSRDPATPGVTLEAAGGGRPPTLTFGSVRLRDERGDITSAITRFDLVEKAIKGYRGYWRTLHGTGETASGYFCISRF
ncbi:MAG: hypothetical protein IPF98_12710 [Gemmatimonadetes bacterium]|nr:hypothetical protein [Gemmatimonadota bacterium]MCC6771474.1 hypothetical protein [Gemmatimonadaceae bacterium]